MIGMLNRHAFINAAWGDNINTCLAYFARYLRALFPEFDWKLTLTKNRSPQLVAGFNFRRHDLTDKYRESFREKYMINLSLSDKEKSLLNTLINHKKNNVVVGLHVRRGDYNSWLGGKYYYSDFDYKNFVQQVRHYYASLGKSCWVIACTNDEGSPACGQDQTSHGRWHADQVILQNCDLLIGPPSTFTMWASYIACVPYIHMKSNNQKFKYSDSCICNG